MRFIIQKILAALAGKIIKKYNPIVIGITGSVGKTSAKEAIALVVRGSARVRSSMKNYNNEFGVPLTIIGVSDSPARSIGVWCAVLMRAFGLLFIRDQSYPDILILEMGADRLGDIEALTTIAPCAIGVLTAIGPAHLEKFGTMEALINEKKQMVRRLGRNATAIVNADDPFLNPIGDDVHSRVITFGFATHADVRAQSFVERYEFRDGEQRMSISFECVYQNQSVELELHHCVGKQSAYAVLAGLSVACALGIPLAQCAHDIQMYRGSKGRMHVVQGMKHTLIIDDTYNSSPLAATESLSVLEKMRMSEYSRRIAVLGDMLELGTYTESEHRKIGALCAARGVDLLYTVGAAAKWIADGAVAAKFDSARVFRFDTVEEIGDVLRNAMKEGDVLLVKGSQGVRLEKGVREIMAEPLRAEELLVRQGKEWK